MKKKQEDLQTDNQSPEMQTEAAGEASADYKTTQNDCSPACSTDSETAVSASDITDQKNTETESSHYNSGTGASVHDLDDQDKKSIFPSGTARDDRGNKIPVHETIRCGFAGLGRIASLLEDDDLREKPCTHAGAVYDNPDCIIAGGFDIDAERREKFSEKWGCPVFDSIDEMIRETKPDILFIATHPDSHLALVENGIKHGIQTIVCEKPLADSLKSAKLIAKYHRKKMSKIMTNHERRYSNDYTAVKEIIRNGKYGKLLSVKGTLYMGKNAKIKNVLWHDGTHMADIIMYLTAGRLKKKKITGSIRKNTGTVFLSCRSGKIPVLIEAGAGRDHLVFQLELSFESGMIRIGNGVYSELESAESPYYSGFNSLKETGTGNEGKTAYFENMVKDAVRCASERDYYPVSSAVDGLNAVSFLSSL